MALGAAAHHSAQQHAAPRCQRTRTTAGEGEVFETREAPMGQNTPHPGEWPAPLLEVRPQGLPERHTEVGFELVLDPFVPQLAEQLVEVVAPAPAVFHPFSPTVSIMHLRQLCFRPRLWWSLLHPCQLCSFPRQWWSILLPRQHLFLHQRQWWSILLPRLLSKRQRMWWRILHPRQQFFQLHCLWWRILHPRLLSKRQRLSWSLCHPRQQCPDRKRQRQVGISHLRQLCFVLEVFKALSQDRVPPLVRGHDLPLPSGWRRAEDASGRVYYWHVHTRQTRWTPPVMDDEDEDEEDEEDEDEDMDEIYAESRFPAGFLPIRMCRWFSCGNCRQGWRCMFAHSVSELHP